MKTKLIDVHFFRRIGNYNFIESIVNVANKREENLKKKVFFCSVINTHQGEKLSFPSISMASVYYGIIYQVFIRHFH